MTLIPEKQYIHGSKPTIGILIDWVSNDFQVSILSGIYDTARKYGMNLICYEGGILKRPKTQDLHDYCRNIIYTFAYKNSVDGLIILSASLGHEISNQELFDFCKSFSPIPMVSIARKVPEVPSVLVDNEKGLRDLLFHLIDVHSCERFVLIKGNDNDDDGLQRHQTFRQVMTEKNIPIDNELMLDGFFYTTTAEKELTKIIEKGRTDFQAIVALNDDMAIGALKVCKLKGYNIPRDFIVTGFDDIRQSSFVEPPITTVRQPLRELGIRAVDILYRQIRGEKVPLEVIIPSSLIIRESCGCEPQCVSSTEWKKRNNPCVSKVVFDELNNPESDTIAGLIEKLINLNLEKSPEAIALHLSETLEKALEDENIELFLHEWEKILQSIYIVFDNNHIIEKILKELLYNSSTHNTSEEHAKKISLLFKPANDLIKKRAVKLEQQINNEFIHNFNVLSDLRDSLVATQDMFQFTHALAQKILVLGIENLYIALYHEGSIGPGGTARLIFAIRDKKLIQVRIDQDMFPSANLLPDYLFPKDKPFAFHIDSLNYTDHLFGFIVFGLNPTYGVSYSNLRRIISHALYGSYLFRRVKKHRNRLKMQKEELNASLEKYHKAMAGFINTLVKTIEIRDPYTAGHQRRVADLARKIAEEMDLSSELIETIRMAAIIHDLGKIYIPAEILNKPGQILDVEFNLIKSHPKIAYEILKSINFPWPIADVVFQHHERLNGSGYPNGLKAPNIVLPARIISIADVVEAMASRRPYRESLGIEKALEEITDKRGVLYDPLIVDICLNLFLKQGYGLKSE